MLGMMISHCTDTEECNVILECNIIFNTGILKAHEKICSAKKSGRIAFSCLQSPE